MQIASPFNFIITPLDGKQYNNVKQVGDIGLITATSIEEAADVQRFGVVKSLPMLYKGEIRIGDTVTVQHNVFRLTYNDKGIVEQSNHFIKDDLYSVNPELVYLYKRDGKYFAADNFVFVKPVSYDDKWLGEREMERIGTLRYINQSLRDQGLREGDLISFRRSCEYRFDVEGEKLYMMGNHRILAKLEF